MASNSSVSSPKPASIEDRLILTQTADEDDSSRDSRRSADGADRPAGQASDNSYLQSAHQGGALGATDEAAPSEGGATAEDDRYASEDSTADADLLVDDAPGSNGAFMYDAGALFPELDMSGPASFDVDGPAWVDVDPATGLLSGMPDLGEVGAFTITVTATDAAGERYAATLELTVDIQSGEPTVADVVVKPAASEAPSTDDASQAPALGTAPSSPSEEPAQAPSDAGENVAGDASDLTFEDVTGEQPAAPPQNAAPAAPEAPVAEEPTAVGQPDAPPSAPEPPVQSAPAAPEAPVAGEPSAVAPSSPEPPVQAAPPAAESPVAEQPAEPPSTPEPPVQAAPPAAEPPVAEQPPAVEPPSAPPSTPEPPVQTAPEPEPPVAEPPVAEEPVAPPAAEPPVQAEPVSPVAPPAPPAAPEPPKTYNVITGTKNADFIVGTQGDDRITGGRGNDTMKGGAGDDEYVFKNDSNGADVFDDGKAGDGYDVAVATDAKVVIGVDGYNDGRTFTKNGATITSTGVDEFQGAGDTIIRDGGSARTLNFSNTKLEGILEIDAGAGNDKVIASDLSDGAYRGGAGNDALTAGDADTTWLYKGASNGSDTFVNGEGHSVAMAEGKGVVIGVDGYSNGVDAFQGNGDTIVRDGGSSRTLSFSNTELNGVLEVDAGAGNDTVIASDLSDAAYRGGAGNDSLVAGKADAAWLYKGASNGSDTFVNGEGHSVATAEGKGVVIGLNGYANGVDAFEGAGDTIVRDGGSSKTLDFSNTELNGVLEVDGGAGNDTLLASNLSDGAYRGGAGDDALTAGAKDATFLYGAKDNGYDTFTNGAGVSVAKAEAGKVVIGVNGFANGVDAFEGAGDTVIRDSNSSKTLNFSDTDLSGVAEVDARGGNDAVTASNLSDGAYRGGAGDDALTAGSKQTTWLYGAGDNGYDTFSNGAGLTVAQAEGSGVVIGVNGFVNGVDAFEGAGDTVIRDSNSSKTLDFSNTELTGVLEVDARGGNDTIIASNLSDASYRGGAGNDALTAGSERSVWLYGSGDNGLDAFTNGAGVSIAQAEGNGVVIGLNGYANGVDGFEGAGDTILRDGGSSKTLNFSDTAFKGVAEVDAGAGNDTVTASNLSEGAYRGGAGDDKMIAGDERTVFVYGAGNNGLDTFTNGAGESLAQAEDKGVVIGVNGYANGVDGVLGAGDTIIRDGGSSKTLDFSNTALKDVAEIDGGAGNDTIVVSNLSETSYRGGAGGDVFVVQKGAVSATIADFDDSGNDRIDLSAFGSNRGNIQSATSLVDADGDSQADDVQIDLGALGGEKGATLTLFDTDLKALNFAAKGDFTVAGDSGAKFAKGQAVMASEGDVDQLFAFDMDTLDQSSGWTASLDAPAPDAGADSFSDSAGLIVFEDGSDNIQASINDSQWG